MSLLLHGIGTPNGESLIEVKDALVESKRFRRENRTYGRCWNFTGPRR
jgi:hypothetical protein